MVEQEEHVGFAQSVGGLARYIEKLIRTAALGVALELDEKAGHEIDRATHLRKFEEMSCHPVIILDAVQPNPRHRVLAGHVVGIIRLVLVPEKSKCNVSH